MAEPSRDSQLRDRKNRWGASLSNSILCELTRPSATHDDTFVAKGEVAPLMLHAEPRLAWIVVSDPSATVCHFFAVPQPPDAGYTNTGATGVLVGHWLSDAALDNTAAAALLSTLSCHEIATGSDVQLRITQ